MYTRFFSFLDHCARIIKVKALTVLFHAVKSFFFTGCSDQKRKSSSYEKTAISWMYTSLMNYSAFFEIIISFKLTIHNEMQLKDIRNSNVLNFFNN